MAWGQGPDGADPFVQKGDNGKGVHVVPTPALLHSKSGRWPTLAPPSNGTAVYPPSYGCSNLIDHGGLEMSNAGFQAIYWNSTVANSTSTSNGYATIQSQVNGFLQSFPDNANWDNSATDDYTIVQQYGSRSWIANSLGVNQTYKASPGSAFVDTQSATSSITDSQIITYIEGLFSSGVLALNSNTIYGVFFPNGTKVSISSSSSSCTQFCAYHSSFSYNGVNVKYAVFPYPGCSGCSPFGYPAADMLTMFVAHETREAVTDPNNAWYDSCGYEADDRCAWSNLYRTSNGNFFVQPEYSNGGTVTASGFTATYPGPGCIVPNVCSSPAAPTGLAATAGNAQVSLMWNAVSGATSYNVKRSTTSGAESTLTSVSGAGYTDSTVTNGITYYYKVSALSSCNSNNMESGNSNEASATPQAAPTGSFSFTPAPAGITITRGKGTAKGSTAITVASSGGFTGNVSLSVSGLPSQTSASFSANPVSVPSNSSATSTLTVTVNRRTPAGSYTLTVTGTSSGVSNATTSVPLKVN